MPKIVSDLPIVRVFIWPEIVTIVIDGQYKLARVCAWLFRKENQGKGWKRR